MTHKKLKNMFTQEEILAAQAARKVIVEGNISELKSVYIAGEICMWDELRQKNLQISDVIKKETSDMQDWSCKAAYSTLIKRLEEKYLFIERETE